MPPSGPLTQITVVRDAARRYHSVLERVDGVTVRLEGGSYNKVGGDARGVPHDIAHLLVEEALGLRGGLWGVLAAGGTVKNAAVIAGRQPPQAAKRAREITQLASRTLWEAEVVVRAVADQALGGQRPDVDALRRACGGEFWPAGAATADGLAALITGLRDAGERWWKLSVGEPFAMVWRLPAPA